MLFSFVELLVLKVSLHLSGCRRIEIIKKKIFSCSPIAVLAVLILRLDNLIVKLCGMKVSKFKDGCCSARLLQSKLYIYPFSISSDVGFSHVTSVLHYLLFESHNPLSRIFKIFPPYK